MFITFEGLAGSGKSTQARFLAERLRSEGKVVTLVRDPGGTPVGDAVRSILNSPEIPINARARLLLHSAARAQLCADVIVPALRRGEVVICDGFTDTSFAQHVGGDGLPALAICNLVDFSTYCPNFHLSPDRTYFLSVPPEAAFRRRLARGDSAELLGANGIEYMRKVDSAYMSLRHFWRVVTVDANGDRDAIASEIYEKLPLSLCRAPALT